jgi:hypothetical protein
LLLNIIFNTLIFTLAWIVLSFNCDIESVFLNSLVDQWRFVNGWLVGGLNFHVLH